MKIKYLFLLIIPFLFLISCHSISQGIYSQITKEDKIIYLKEQRKLYPDKPIDIFKDNKLIATIKLGQDLSTLKIIYSEENSYDLWKYYDYSGIDKITQSKDENTIRIYHWSAPIAALLPNRLYVTEFNINSKSKKSFRLKK